MQRTLAALGTALALFTGGCAGEGTGTNAPPTSPPSSAPPPSTVASPTTVAPASTPPTTDAAASVIDWDDPSVVVDLGEGWTIGACEGEAPFLCVERDGNIVGGLEAISYPVDSFDALDPAAAPAENLDTFVAEFHEAMSTDRASGCGADYGFESIGPDPFVLGGHEAIGYGFAGTLADGSPSELNLQYATIVGDTIVSVVAIAYDEGGCPGRDDLSTWDSATLSEFRSRMEQVLEVSPLPEG